MTIKCMVVACENNAVHVKYEGKTLILCSYHQDKISDSLRNYYSYGVDDDGYEDCPNCFFGGRRNKRTKKCREEMCENLKTCKECGKRVASNKITYRSNEGLISFCSKSHHEKFLEAEKKKFEELRRKLEQNKNQKVSLLREAVKNGEDISDWDWETGNWLDDEQKELCRNYVKDFREKEKVKAVKELWMRISTDIKNKKDISHYNWRSSNILDEKYKKICRDYEIILKGEEGEKQIPTKNPCEKCNLIFSTYYTIGGKGHYCNDCADKLLAENNSSNSDKSAKCQDCGTEIDIGTYCSNCSEKVRNKNLPINIKPSYKFDNTKPEEDNEFERAFNEIQKNINAGNGNLIILPTKLTKQQLIFLSAWQDAAISNKHINIDELELPKDKKEELYQLFKDSNVKSFGMSWKDDSKQKKKLVSILFIGGLIFVAAIVLAVIIKKRKRKSK